jgi:hypothetical protein
MITIIVNGVQVRIFWSGAVKIGKVKDEERAKAIMRYLRAEGYLENEYLNTLSA